jgi:hypothetical protein
VPVIKLSYIQINADLQGDALLKFETAGNADVLLTISIAGLAEMEAKLINAILELAKHQTKQ